MQTPTQDPQLPPSCAEVAGPLAALALGAELADEERTLLLDHLLFCAACRGRLEAYAAVALRLPLAAPDATPPPGLRDRLLAATSRAAPAAPPVPAARSAPWPGWRRLLTPGLGLALAVLLAFGVNRELAVRALQGQVSAQQAQTQTNLRTLLAAFGNDDALEAYLHGGSAAPEAWGRVFISPGEPAVTIYARGLPQLPEGQQYQVWVVTPTGTVSAGSFPVNAEGRGWRPLRPAAPLGAVERVFVTVGPTGGSPQPPDEIFLEGTP